MNHRSSFGNRFAHVINAAQMNAEASKTKGDTLVAQAEKKLKSWSFFNSSKNEEASELLEKAANHYKLAKACWRYPSFRSLTFSHAMDLGKKAADTYKQLAEVYTKLGSQHEAASAYVEASKALTKIQSEGRALCKMPITREAFRSQMPWSFCTRLLSSTQKWAD